VEVIVLLHRVVALVLVLVGFGAGWLARGTEVPEAEAARFTVWRCVQTRSSLLVAILNPTDSDITYTKQFITPTGNEGEPSPPLSLAARARALDGTTSGDTMVIRSRAPIFVGGMDSSEADSAQANCFKGK
jgi:hypothetical protein